MGAGEDAAAAGADELTSPLVYVIANDFLKCRTFATQDPVTNRRYIECFPSPCKGKLQISEDTPYFIHGRMAVKGNGGGRYPTHYLDMIDNVFGTEPNTIEACSRTVRPDKTRTAFTVDVNADFKPSLVTDAQTLAGVDSCRFNRWRADPPYNAATAKEMYGVELPNFKRMVEAGARVCKVGSLLFLLLGPDNYQHVPDGVMRVGLIYISVIPNNETRALNIYYKYKDVKENSSYQGRLF